MAEIKIVKYKMRRGSDETRRKTVLHQGELGYTTDTERIFVGNGFLSGGKAAGVKVHPPITNISLLSTVNAERGDLIFANNTMYQLTGANYASLSAWLNLGTRIDTKVFAYTSNNTLTLGSSAVSATNIDPSSIGNGITISGGVIQADFQPKSLHLSGGKLSLKAAGIDEREISASSFSSPISGGSGQKIFLNFDENHFKVENDKLKIASFPTGSFTFQSIDSDWVGSGLQVDGVNEKIKAYLTAVDNETIQRDIYGVIGVVPGLIPETIYDVLTGHSSTNPIFNGTPQHSLSGGIPDLEVTVIDTLSSNGVSTQSVSLTSAGFITFEGTRTTRNGQVVGRYAIPIFAY